jgi:hypothetical protein
VAALIYTTNSLSLIGLRYWSAMAPLRAEREALLMPFVPQSLHVDKYVFQNPTPKNADPHFRYGSMPGDVGVYFRQFYEPKHSVEALFPVRYFHWCQRYVRYALEQTDIADWSSRVFKTLDIMYHLIAARAALNLSIPGALLGDFAIPAGYRAFVSDSGYGEGSWLDGCYKLLFIGSNFTTPTQYERVNREFYNQSVLQYNQLFNSTPAGVVQTPAFYTDFRPWMREGVRLKGHADGADILRMQLANNPAGVAAIQQWRLFNLRPGLPVGPGRYGHANVGLLTYCQRVETNDNYARDAPRNELISKSQTDALMGGWSNFTAVEAAVVEMARALVAVPSYFDEIKKHIGRYLTTSVVPLQGSTLPAAAQACGVNMLMPMTPGDYAQINKGQADAVAKANKAWAVNYKVSLTGSEYGNNKTAVAAAAAVKTGMVVVSAAFPPAAAFVAIGTAVLAALSATLLYFFGRAQGFSSCDYWAEIPGWPVKDLFVRGYRGGPNCWAYGPSVGYGVKISVALLVFEHLGQLDFGIYAPDVFTQADAAAAEKRAATQNTWFIPKPPVHLKIPVTLAKLLSKMKPKERKKYVAALYAAAKGAPKTAVTIKAGALFAAAAKAQAALDKKAAAKKAAAKAAAKKAVAKKASKQAARQVVAEIPEVPDAPSEVLVDVLAETTAQDSAVATPDTDTTQSAFVRGFLLRLWS